MHEKFLELGMESPFDSGRMARMLESENEGAVVGADARREVVVDIRGHNGVMREALLAHATQVDPTSRFWFGLPTDVTDDLYPYDEYVIARDLTGSDSSGDDLFAGLDAVPAI
jgi:mycothiol S-conjugate amidase